MKCEHIHVHRIGGKMVGMQKCNIIVASKTKVPTEHGDKSLFLCFAHASEYKDKYGSTAKGAGKKAGA